MARNLESKVVDRILSELEKLPIHRRVDVLDYVKTRVKQPAIWDMPPEDEEPVVDPPKAGYMG